MPRPPKDWQPLPSQRAPREERAVEAEETAKDELIGSLRDQLRQAMNQCNGHQERARRLQEEVTRLELELKPVLDGKCASYSKLKPQSTAFYDHVKKLVKWLSRFEHSDVAPLVGTALKLLDNGRQTNCSYEVLMSDGMKAARGALRRANVSLSSLRKTLGKTASWRPRGEGDHAAAEYERYLRALHTDDVGKHDKKVGYDEYMDFHVWPSRFRTATRSRVAFCETRSPSSCAASTDSTPTSSSRALVARYMRYSHRSSR